MGMTIGEAARKSGCSVPTIRYYESIGLVAPAARSANGRRSLGWPDVTRLRFIRRSREFGMTLEQVRELLEASADSADGCAAMRGLVQQRLDEVARRRAELAALEASLQAMADRCDAGCGASGGGACTIAGDIAGGGLADRLPLSNCG
ncbi:MAG: MerR family DNA-binding protein [Sphingomonadales bacterium]|nr:MerR family DNA-binding protein [Sphingomonadales bacterium]